MDESFELPVTYKGEELLFPAQLLQYGYTHRFQVEVHGVSILFEPDEDRNYRALADVSILNSNKKIEIELLQAIAATIEAITS